MVNIRQLYKIFQERNALQWRLARATFEVWQTLGFHVVADHFCDPVPNTRTIKQTYIAGPRELPGITANWQSLIFDACALMDANVDEYISNREMFGYYEHNRFFGGLDALYYYSFIRTQNPGRIIEVGQGFSTRIALAALTRNCNIDKSPPELISIDPYTRLTIEAPGPVRYSTLRKPLQEIGGDIPTMLSTEDLLFVDSSHVLKFGSDVKFLFENVYPRLKVGVRLHMHDIFTPFDYPIDWMLKQKLFWNEQYFLESFLSYNTDFRIDAPLNYVAQDGAADRMLSAHGIAPDVVGRWGCSLYLTRTKCRGSENEAEGAHAHYSTEI
jgi:Methyltransferase domain